MLRHAMPLIISGMILFMCSLAPAAEQLYRLDIRVTSAVNGQPAIYGRMMMSPRVEHVEYPDSVVSLARLSVFGLELDGTGRVVVLVKEGKYHITITKDDHQTVTLEGTVPPEEAEPPAPGQIPTFQLSIEMPVQTKQLPRDIVVKVLEETTDAAGRRVTRPLPNASVFVGNSDTGDVVDNDVNGSARRSQTGEDGVAIFHSEDALAIGDRVLVRATKYGYEAAEQYVTIGAGGPETGAIGLSSLSAWDSVGLTLRKARQKPQDAKLIVRVVDANTDKPVSDAQVYIKAIGAPAQGPTPTNAQGLTGTFTLPPTTAEEVHMVYRLSVRKDGYAEKWEDLPNEYLEPSLEPRTYPVQLTAMGAKHWTAAEQAAFARYRAWAAGKGGKEDPPMFGTEPTGAFTWEETYRAPGDKLIKLKFSTRCSHPADHPAGPPPEPNYDDVIRGREDLAKATIGGYPGMGSAYAYHGANFSWHQGWFNASLSVSSPWITHPELGEVKRWAEQMAGVIGDPGQ